MKFKTFHLIAVLTLCVLGLASCGKSAKEPSALIAQSERINDELTALADQSPAFLEAATASYADGVLTVDIVFSDENVKVNDCSDALVQFVVAQYIKSHTGKDLDTVLNTLLEENGKMEVKITGADGATRSCDIAAKRLAQLLKLKPMELGYNDARADVLAMLDARCAGYKDQYKAVGAEFEVKGNFAQYTITFEKATAYANLNQASLTGRYLKELKRQYEDYGACRPMVEDLLKSLSIEGYRFIYTDVKDTKTLSAGIPWRTINQ